MKPISRRDAFKRGGAALIGGVLAMAVGEIPSAKAETYGRPTGGHARELWDNWQDAVIKAGDLHIRHRIEWEAIENLPGDALHGEFQRRKEAFPGLENAMTTACEDELALRGRIFEQSDTPQSMRWVKGTVERVVARAHHTARNIRELASYRPQPPAGHFDASCLKAALSVMYMQGELLA